MNPTTARPRPASRLLALTAAGSLWLGLAASPAHAQAQARPAAPEVATYQITGLFAPDREKDLRDAFAKLPQFKLLKVDYGDAEVTLEYDRAKAFPDAKTPAQVIEQLDNALRGASRYTFGAKAVRTTPKDRLKLIEIDVAGLDCKGCSLGAYDAVYRLPGVERATASFKVGKVTALVDPAKIDRPALVKALKDRGVEVKSPGD